MIFYSNLNAFLNKCDIMNYNYNNYIIMQFPAMSNVGRTLDLR